MENAAEALKMAGAVLIFVLALSIIILSFNQVRETADIILDYRDRETMYIDGKYYYEASGTERQVGLETVIPSIIRAYTENYKVVFIGLKAPIYKIKLSDGTIVEKYSLDLETNQDSEYKNVILANNEQKSEFLCGILYGDFSKMNGDNLAQKRSNFQNKFNISLDGCESIYNQINEINKSGKKITEYLGVYYQDDNENVPDVNKTEKRIITYKVQ